MKFLAILPRDPSFRSDLTLARKAMMAAASEPTSAVTVEVEAESMEEVFAKLNHGSGDTLPGYHGRSLSVGDLVDGPDGTYMVASCGFERLFPKKAS